MSAYIYLYFRVEPKMENHKLEIKQGQLVKIKKTVFFRGGQMWRFIFDLIIYFN